LLRIKPAAGDHATPAAASEPARRAGSQHAPELLQPHAGGAAQRLWRAHGESLRCLGARVPPL